MITVSLLSAGMAAHTANQAGKQQAAWADYEAKQGEADANAERGAGQVEAERIRKMGKRQQAEAQAAFAGAGIGVGEGTPLDINRDIAAGAEADAYMAIVAGDDRGARLDAGAQGARLSGANAQYAGKMSAYGSMLEGASAVAGGWKSSKSAGTGFKVSSGTYGSNMKGGG
ncbi:hypothetical protein [Arenimonas alkanexedens]